MKNISVILKNGTYNATFPPVSWGPPASAGQILIDFLPLLHGLEDLRLLYIGWDLHFSWLVSIQSL